MESKPKDILEQIHDEYAANNPPLTDWHLRLTSEQHHEMRRRAAERATRRMKIEDSGIIAKYLTLTAISLVLISIGLGYL